MPNDKQKLGTFGEACARDYLVSKNFTVLETNYRTRFCEIDIIAQIDQTICFTEVKTRKNINKGLPKEAVTHTKQKKIIQGAQFYLKAKNLYDQRIRFDVMEVYVESDNKDCTRINLIENAFWGS